MSDTYDLLDGDATRRRQRLSRSQDMIDSGDVAWNGMERRVVNLLLRKLAKFSPRKVTHG